MGAKINPLKPEMAVHKTPFPDIGTQYFDYIVEPCLGDPLWVQQNVAPPVAAEVMATCAQIELLCRKELAQRTEGQINQGVVSTSFETKGLMLREKLRSLLESQQPRPTIEEYLGQSAMDRLFPRTAAYVRNPKDPELLTDPVDMDSYFDQMARLNQVVSIATQIGADVSNPPNHKYLSHQLAVLHLSLSWFKGYKPIAELKRNIETNFEVLKTALARCEKKEPKLTEEHSKWLLDLTNAVVSTLTSLPAELTPSATLPAYLLTRLN